MILAPTRPAEARVDPRVRPRAESSGDPHPTASASIALGGALDVGGPSLGALVGARLHLREHLALGALLVAPITATSVEGPEGRATLRALVPGLDVAAPLELASGALRVVPSAGLGVSVLLTRGDAEAPYEGAGDAASALLPFARVEIAPRLAGPVRGSVQALGGAALPAIGVRFAGREAAAWQAFGGAFVGATIDL
jgi:hypothetical protein